MTDGELLAKYVYNLALRDALGAVKELRDADEIKNTEEIKKIEEKKLKLCASRK